MGAGRYRQGSCRCRQQSRAEAHNAGSHLPITPSSTCATVIVSAPELSRSRASFAHSISFPVELTYPHSQHFFFFFFTFT